MGAWIEIKAWDEFFGAKLVAPLMGAWIEIEIHVTKQMKEKSRPSWARGLKYSSYFLKLVLYYRRAPHGRVD